MVYQQLGDFCPRLGTVGGSAVWEVPVWESAS